MSHADVTTRARPRAGQAAPATGATPPEIQAHCPRGFEFALQALSGSRAEAVALAVAVCRCGLARLALVPGHYEPRGRVKGGGLAGPWYYRPAGYMVFRPRREV